MNARRKLIQVIDLVTKKQLDDQGKAIATQQATVAAQQKTIVDQQTAMSAQSKAIADQQTAMSAQATSQSQAMSAIDQRDAGQDKSLADLKAAVDQLLAKPALIYEDSYTAVVNTPTLALNATQDIVLTWDRPFSGTNYVVSILHDVSLLGKATFTVKAKTKTTVTITMMASVLLSVQGGLRAYGRYYGLPAGA